MTATICLTYDDGLPSHLQTVIPQLDSLGLKATFFLNAISGASILIGESSSAVTGWRRAAVSGHEIGNHTLFHPCPQTFGWKSTEAIEQYSLAQLLSEINTQASLLDALDPVSTERSFAYPCNNFIVEGKDYSTSLKALKLFRYARAGGDSTSILSSKTSYDLLKIPSWLVNEGATFEELVAFAEKARHVNGIAIYQFHGIGAEFFRVSADTHKRFLQYLAEHAAAFRVLTFSQAMSERRFNVID